MTYVVGGTRQFTHSEFDEDGNAIGPEAGHWAVSNPAVAAISQSGLATWLAAGETEIIFVVSPRMAGAYHIVVVAAVAATLAATPSSISVRAGEVASLAITALDAGSNPVTDFPLESATSDDGSVADVVIVAGDELLVIGKAEGTCHIAVVSGAANTSVAVTVLAAAGGAVDSVFGRAGAVVAVSGDYDVSQVTGAATAASVTAEATARAAADTSEATSRAAADTTLQTHIDAEATARASAVSGEATARAGADTSLSSAIASEATTRGNADSSLAASLASEISTRAADDITLAASIAAESSARAGADTTETAARVAADSSEASTRASADTAEASTRAAADTTEAAARAAADALLAPLASPALTGHPTGVTEAPGDNSARLATTGYADAAVGVAAASGSSAVAAEAAARVAADALLAPLASPALSGAPTAPTQAALDNSGKIATTAYTDAAVGVEASARVAAINAAVAALVNSSPALLDTLKELADAIGDDPNFAATMTAALALKAPLASPSLSGTPTAPTAAALDNSTKIATTAYADLAVAVEAAARASADSTESAARVAADALKAPLASPVLTGHPTGVTESPLDNSTRLATTAYADAAVAVEAARAASAEALKAPLASPALSGHPTGVTESPLDNSTRLATTAYADAAVAVEASRALAAEALKAPLASPALSGTPTAPTAAGGTNSGQIATTAFVAAAVAGVGGAVASVFGRVGAVVKVAGDYAVADVTGAAPLASPAFTGHPTGVTETALDNSTRLASTAYADAAVSAEASARSTAVALKADIASPALTGHPTGVTESPGDNSTRLASTAYADAAVAVEVAARGTAVSAEATARTNADALLAPLASPALTGHPTGVTEAAGNNSTRLASTGFVAAAIAGVTVGSVARASVSYTTGSLANGAVETGTITIPLSSLEAMLQSITTDHNVWIRIYSTAAARTADASRNINKDPAPGVGVLADFLVNGTTVAATPPVFLYNNDTVPVSTLYLSITNKSGGTATTAISFVLRPL